LFDDASGAPQADHEIAPGQKMGMSLPLLTPERDRPAPSKGEMDTGDQEPHIQR